MLHAIYLVAALFMTPIFGGATVALIVTINVLEAGPLPVVFASAVAAAAVAAISYWPATLIEELGHKHARWVIPRSAFVGALLVPILVLATNANYKALKAEAETAKTVGLKHFAQLDTDTDGVVTDYEILQRIKRFDRRDRETLLFIARHSQLIGHCLSMDDVPGVSRQDLETYPQRIDRRFRNWR